MFLAKVQLVAAQPGQAVAGSDDASRQRAGSSGTCDRRCCSDLGFFRACRRSVRSLRARLTAASTSTGAGSNSGPVDRVDSHIPVRILRATHDELFEGDLLRALDWPPPATERHLRLRLLRLGRDDIERCHHPHIQADLIVLDQLRRQVHGLPRDVDRLDRVHKVPVGLADARERVDDRGLELEIRDVSSDLGDEDLLAVGIDREPAQERLGVLRGAVEGIPQIAE